jgi:uncharacterized membrane protein
MEISLEIIIVICAFFGFAVASYIRHTKKNELPLICPLEGSCEKVIYSEHSTFFGISLETWGVFYYGIVALSDSLFIFLPNAMPLWFIYAVLGASTFAFIFSIYLTILQAVVLRHWCTWCLISAGISTIIFILSFVNMNQEIMLMLGKL